MADTPLDPAAGAPTPVGKQDGVPVVDLTATVAGLYGHAEAARVRAYAAEQLAASCRREADYLEDLARVLSGGPRGE